MLFGAILVAIIAAVVAAASFVVSRTQPQFRRSPQLRSTLIIATSVAGIAAALAIGIFLLYTALMPVPSY